MKQRSIGLFFQLSGIVFLLTAGAKLISITGTARILNNLDPIFHISFRHILCIAAVVELSVAAICLFGKNQDLKAGLIAMLASIFTLYRFGLYWQGYGSVCHCLGNLTDALHIPPQVADNIMKVVLAYLLIGSYGILFWQWKSRRRKTDGGSQRTEVGGQGAKI